LEEAENIAEVVELIRKIGMGDRVSFDTFYHRFSALIYSTALRVLASESDAEDVAQEVFFMLWEKAPLYDPSRGKPLTWAAVLTRNKCIDRIRSQQRRNRLSEMIEESGNHCPADGPAPAFGQMVVREQVEAMRRALNELPVDQRHAIELAFLGGLTQTEVAAELELPLGTIKARIRRGMLQLRT